ncbi:MAG TPA: aldehyde dehydrogenase family protein, partial [Anaerolineae bacterium]|nr:aldehyde dehydrogenase family protein [Anaerolineae bacterium]
MDYQLFINGEWVNGSETTPVYNKYNDQIIGTLPIVNQDQLDQAIAAAERAASVMADMPSYKRAAILFRTAELLKERKEDIAKTIAAEAGKALKFARIEVDRAIST